MTDRRPELVWARIVAVKGKDMADPRFKKLSDALAPLVAAGSQHWQVFRLID